MAKQRELEVTFTRGREISPEYYRNIMLQFYFGTNNMKEILAILHKELNNTRR